MFFYVYSILEEPLGSGEKATQGNTELGRMFELFRTEQKVRAEFPRFFNLLAGYGRGWTSGDAMERPHKLIGDVFRRARATTLAAASAEVRFPHFKEFLEQPSMLGRLEEPLS